jgi:hypothetical protein
MARKKTVTKTHRLVIMATRSERDSWVAAAANDQRSFSSWAAFQLNSKVAHSARVPGPGANP